MLDPARPPLMSPPLNRCNCEHPEPEPAAVAVTGSRRSQLGSSRVSEPEMPRGSPGLRVCRGVLGLASAKGFVIRVPACKALKAVQQGCIDCSNSRRVQCESALGTWGAECHGVLKQEVEYAARRIVAPLSLSSSIQSNASSTGLPMATGVMSQSRPLEDSHSNPPSPPPPITSTSTSYNFSITQMVEEGSACPLESRSPYSPSRAAVESRPSGSYEQRPRIKGALVSTAWWGAVGYDSQRLIEELLREQPSLCPNSGWSDAGKMDKYTMTSGSPLARPRASLFKPQLKADEFKLLPPWFWVF
ncbi:hypothetical protein JZ751_023381 [Albula glossodonta]|uniref:Uncharacterized protein n=1 Tax=Albula glossodonta TaxID=121402 RepID=A0A8T2NI94_9TELE|nr:hypothetical protein JZ751_023381 [Albula glossodonta]